MPGAAHFYIHIVEKERPQLAETVADNLGGLAPGAGHLVHMPSHIYLRVGRYHDATEANQAARSQRTTAISPNAAIRVSTPLMYMPHNWHLHLVRRQRGRAQRRSHSRLLTRWLHVSTRTRCESPVSEPFSTTGSLHCTRTSDSADGTRFSPLLSLLRICSTPELSGTIPGV